jgi:hypothetical protein
MELASAAASRSWRSAVSGAPTRAEPRPVRKLVSEHKIHYYVAGGGFGGRGFGGAGGSLGGGLASAGLAAA